MTPERRSKLRALLSIRREATLTLAMSNEAWGLASFSAAELLALLDQADAGEVAMTAPARARSLTGRQRDLLVYIGQYQDNHGISPTVEEMRAHLGMASKSGPARLLDILEREGFISRQSHGTRAIRPLVRVEPQVLAQRRA